jgi:hypothetical protein
MKNFLIHKNLSLYYRLRRRIGKERAFRIEKTVEKIILGIDDILFVISFLIIIGITLFWFISVFLKDLLQNLLRGVD